MRGQVWAGAALPRGSLAQGGSPAKSSGSLSRILLRRGPTRPHAAGTRFQRWPRPPPPPTQTSTPPAAVLLPHPCNPVTALSPRPCLSKERKISPRAFWRHLGCWLENRLGRGSRGRVRG